MELEKQIETKDQEIAELSKELTGRGRKRGPGGGGVDVSALEDEIRTLKEKVDEDQTTITKLKDEISTTNVKLKNITEEKNELDRKNRSQLRRIEELEKESRDNLRKSQAAENSSREMNKLKSQNIKISQQLTDENEALKEEVREFGF
jgi:hypothetical protein